MEDKHSKTEEATPKKISDSKKKGQVPKSADFNSAFSSLVFDDMQRFVDDGSISLLLGLLYLCVYKSP